MILVSMLAFAAASMGQMWVFLVYIVCQRREKIKFKKLVLIMPARPIEYDYVSQSLYQKSKRILKLYLE